MACSACAARSRNRAAHGGTPAKKSANCIRPKSFYEEIDTSGWAPNEVAVLKSQINVYDSRCEIYGVVVDRILAKYGKDLPSAN